MDGEVGRLTHYLFRYPAKFHPPVVRTLLQQYTKEGALVLDPFCGSGTLLVEAAVLGRRSIGLDVDPVAVLVAQAKVHRYQVLSLRRSAARVLKKLERYRRPETEYFRRRFPQEDLTERQYRSQVKDAQKWVPAIPNLAHWFRRYVVVDLARILQTIERARIPASHRLLLRVVFASIIRNASNADPVPVSGLEVTSHMIRRDKAGRVIDPFGLFDAAVGRAIDACEDYKSQAQSSARATVFVGDATRLDQYLDVQVDAVVTSPPYHGAVDYYRRHQLEMFWLGQTKTQRDRLDLLHSYVGRPKVPESHPFVAKAVLRTKLAKNWEARIRKVSDERANAFRHYLIGMKAFFDNLAHRVPPGAPVILIVGHSAWNNSEIPTTKLFAEIAGARFRLHEVLKYPVKNRYMSYSRHNNADISTEYVLVFKRTRREATQPTKESEATKRKQGVRRTT